MVIVYSASKGLAAMTLAIAHSRGLLDYEERMAHYSPEFAQHGTERITVRQLLAHQAGLFAFDEPVDRSVVADLDRLLKGSEFPHDEQRVYARNLKSRRVAPSAPRAPLHTPMQAAGGQCQYAAIPPSRPRTINRSGASERTVNTETARISDRRVIALRQSPYR